LEFTSARLARGQQEIHFTGKKKLFQNTQIVHIQADDGHSGRSQQKAREPACDSSQAFEGSHPDLNRLGGFHQLLNLAFEFALRVRVDLGELERGGVPTGFPSRRAVQERDMEITLDSRHDSRKLRLTQSDMSR